jgi:hypothetical protein
MSIWVNLFIKGDEKRMDVQDKDFYDFGDVLDL